MKNLKMILLTSVGTMVLTLIHHSYGAIIYEAPFRLHVAFFAVPIIAILLITYWVFMTVTILVPIGTIGLYEGGYNHFLKNLLFFGGTSQATLDVLFPPPAYEMPNDFLFEATSIFQFLTGIICLYYFFNLLVKNLMESLKAA